MCFVCDSATWATVAGSPTLKVPIYMLEDICSTGYIERVLIDWTRSFDDWLDEVTKKADRGDRHAQVVLELVTAELDVLGDLRSMPEVETPTLRRVRQSKQNTVWRVGHPYVAGAAVRLIVWFPPERPDQVVVALFANDKAHMGDVFYDGVGSRADDAISRYRTATEGENDG